MTKDESLLLFEQGNKLHWTAKTMGDYLINIKQFYNYFPAIPNVEDFTPDHVEEWLNYLNEETKLKPTSRRLKYASVKAMYVYLNEETNISVNPTIGVKAPSPVCGILPVIDRHSMFQLREVMKYNPRDRAILETLYATGVRVRELCDMQISHLHEDTREIDIPKGKDEKPRVVLITPRCLEWINNYKTTRNDDNPYLFITQSKGPFHRQSIWMLLKGYSTLAGLKKNANPHAFRRTFATILYKNGVSIEKISRLMGHRFITTTERYIKIDYVGLI
ncbi:MAG: hypothetical protein APF81_09005 [Desulfosporosinus sp. BRH_c37]|nr:MAG: hypothetical protein APF81_09005 [Desulfosporosinus sp. BRH_c37]